MSQFSAKKKGKCISRYLLNGFFLYFNIFLEKKNVLIKQHLLNETREGIVCGSDPIEIEGKFIFRKRNVFSFFFKKKTLISYYLDFKLSIFVNSVLFIKFDKINIFNMISVSDYI